MKINKTRLNVGINKNILQKIREISLLKEVPICDIIEHSFKSYDTNNLSYWEYKYSLKNNMERLTTDVDMSFLCKIIQISKALSISRSFIIEKILEDYIRKNSVPILESEDQNINTIEKTEVRINNELLSFYKKIYNKDSQSNKNVIEDFINNEISLNEDININNKTIKDKNICVHTISGKYSKLKLKSLEKSLPVGDYLNYYLIQKIQEIDIIDTNKYFLKNSLQLKFPVEISSYKLDSKIKIEIDNLIKENNIKLNKFEGDVSKVIYNLYTMMFIFKYSTNEINKCFNDGGSPRQIQKIIKKLGWTLSSEEIQQRAVDRGIRNYKQIKTTTKETMLKNSQIGSKPEDYVRYLANHKLTRIFPDSEIIVGLNNLSILNCGKEIDIPIIIIKDNTYYKFAIEYQGIYWHDSEERIREDNLKKEIISDKGYNLFYIVEEKQYTDKQRKLFIEEELDKIILKIRDTIN